MFGSQKPQDNDKHSKAKLWPRPTPQELDFVLPNTKATDNCNRVYRGNLRKAERFKHRIPVEVVPNRGNVISALTRDISSSGIGLIHRGPIEPGEVDIYMTSDSGNLQYRVLIKWCIPTEHGMFISGGKFLGKPF